MPRVTTSKTTKARHKKILKITKGFRGRAKNTFRAAMQRGEKSLQYAYRDRRTKKRDFRRLWIQRINAGARQYGIAYSQLINGLKLANIEIDRKVLADLAVNEADSFKEIVALAQEALKKAA